MLCRLAWVPQERPGGRLNSEKSIFDCFDSTVLARQWGSDPCQRASIIIYCARDYPQWAVARVPPNGRGDTNAKPDYQWVLYVTRLRAIPHAGMLAEASIQCRSRAHY